MYHQKAFNIATKKKWNKIYKKDKKPLFENIQHTEVVNEESKTLDIISTECGFLTFYVD